MKNNQGITCCAGWPATLVVAANHPRISGQPHELLLSLDGKFAFVKSINDFVGCKF